MTVDRRVSLSPEQTGPDSLVGQLVARWFDGNPNALLEQLAVRPPTATEPDMALGTTLGFGNASGSGWLFCLATKTDHGSRTSWQELTLAYDALWGAMRRENSSAVAVPVIGAGFARSQLPFNGLLLVLVLSYHAASLEGRVSKCLKVVVSREEFDPRAFNTVGRGSPPDILGL